MPQPVHQIAVGNEFAIFLTTSGQLFSFGENDRGELGLGDTDPRHSPTLIPFTKNTKVQQISCGFKHCVAKTGLGKVFVWGWGEFG